MFARLAPSLLRRLRLGLLALMLVCGQAAMLAHAAEHAGDSDDGGEPAHLCLLCVAGHNLDGAAPAASAPALPVPAGAGPTLLAVLPSAAARFLAGVRARAPPAA